MVTELQITCANKNTRGLIVRIGGDGWSLSIHDAIVKIMSRQLLLSIVVGNEYYEVDVAGESSDAYLILAPIGKPLHEIDGLKSC